MLRDSDRMRFQDTRLSLHDSHLHLQDVRLLPYVEEIMRKTELEGIQMMVVNGTQPNDWSAVLDLYRRFPTRIVPSLGLHPWHTPQPDDAWKSALTQLLDQHPAAAIGECGLDRWMPTPDIAAQEDAFRFQLALAAGQNRPLSIHVLQAWGWLLDILRDSTLPSRGFLLHSYNGSLETAKVLLDLGAYFSFSGYFLLERKAKVREVFSQLPHDRILIETDAPDMPLPSALQTHTLANSANHPAHLKVIASELTNILGISNLTDAHQVFHRNFHSFFG